MEWFKMQTVWGASVAKLSDAEAGRFIKALYAFVRDGEEYEGSGGREDPTIWLALEPLREEVEAYRKREAELQTKKEEISRKRREAAGKRWMQTKANASKPVEMHANAPVCIDLDANASQNKNKNKKSEKETPLKGGKEKFTPPTVEEADAYIREMGLCVDARSFVCFYTAVGWTVKGTPMTDWQAMAQAWHARGIRKMGAPGKTVSAQRYEQRSYTEDELMAVSGDLIEEARRRAAGE